MKTSDKPSIAFWIIAIIALVWNIMGVVRYVLQAYNTESFRAEFNEEQLALIDSAPAWITGVFAIAVFSGLLGCIFLLLKRKWAIPVFLVSLIAVIIQMGNSFFFTDAIGVFGWVNGLIMPVIVILIAMFLYMYSKIVSGKGWLR